MIVGTHVFLFILRSTLYDDVSKKNWSGLNLLKIEYKNFWIGLF